MVENPGREKRYITNSEIDYKCMQLAKEIKNKFPEVKYVYGVPRGGIPIAIKLSHMTDLEYISPLTFAHDYSAPLGEIIIIDDISDSGNTFLRICDEIKYNTASLYLREDSYFAPDIVCEKIKKEWLVFPWERNDKINKLYDKAVNTWTLDKVRFKLVEEMAEFTQEIVKFMQHKKEYKEKYMKNFIEEMVDVDIVFSQLKQALLNKNNDFAYMYSKLKTTKLQRLNSILNDIEQKKYNYSDYKK